MKWNNFRTRITMYMHPLFKGKIKFDYNGGWSNKFKILYEGKALAMYWSDSLHWRVFNEFYPVIPDDFGESLKMMKQMTEDQSEIKGISPNDVADTIMKVFNNLSIKDALNSDNKLIRAIALMDKRCGSKTFKSLDYSTEEDFLLRNIYNLRKHLEKIEKLTKE